MAWGHCRWREENNSSELTIKGGSCYNTFHTSIENCFITGSLLYTCRGEAHLHFVFSEVSKLYTKKFNAGVEYSIYLHSQLLLAPLVKMCSLTSNKCSFNKRPHFQKKEENPTFHSSAIYSVWAKKH